MRDQPWDYARQHRRCNDEKQRGTQDCCDLRHASPLMLSKRGPADRAECQSRGQGGVDAVPSSERLGRLAHPYANRNRPQCLLRVNRVILAPCLQLPVYPRNGHGTGNQNGSVPSQWMHIETPATLESANFERSTVSHLVAYSRVTACDRLRLHSATANDYCP